LGAMLFPLAHPTPGGVGGARPARTAELIERAEPRVPAAAGSKA
jgi:hypothetical protein